MMRHTELALEQAARRVQELAEAVEPATPEATVSADDLDAVAEASEAVRTDEARLREAVQAARAHGRSWNQLAPALGVSRQAARHWIATKGRL